MIRQSWRVNSSLMASWQLSLEGGLRERDNGPTGKTQRLFMAMAVEAVGRIKGKQCSGA